VRQRRFHHRHRHADADDLAKAGIFGDLPLARPVIIFAEPPPVGTNAISWGRRWRTSPEIEGDTFAKAITLDRRLSPAGLVRQRLRPIDVAMMSTAHRFINDATNCSSRPDGLFWHFAIQPVVADRAQEKI